ncbi:translocation/assembly module TamB domain-containing protein [Methylomonas koyamae]|nr:translocation/assembly module TamB domain-containing protein [Methylomonas koyamae]BBL56442.1 hypothetical protein MKFW12EY_00550 [Methylomonas koyamae]
MPGRRQLTNANIAYSITGSSQSRASKSVGNMITGSALTYVAGRLSWLTESLGVDEFDVQQSQNLSDTLVTAGHYLTSIFYVGTKLGLFNTQAILVLKHKLADSINVETQSGAS